MAIADPKNPDTAVRVQSGDTLSSIAKANGLTLSEIKALNPTLMSNPKYDNGNTVFSNTKVNIAPAKATTGSGGGTNDAANAARLAAEAKAAADKAAQDAANAKAAADATKAAADATKAAADATKAAAEREAARLAALAKNSVNLGGSNAVPYYPPATPPSIPPTIKTATPQFILFNDDEVPIDAMVDLLFENIGGQELLSIARADTVNGQKILYQPIKNLNILKEQYNPNNIIRLQNTSDKLFSNFSIKLADKIPNVGNGFYYSSGNKIYDGTTVYLDDEGNLVIEFVNMLEGEQAEIEITSSGIINEVGI